MDSVEFEVEQDFTAREMLCKPAIMLVQNLGSSLITWLYDSSQDNQSVCWYVLLWLTVVCVCIYGCMFLWWSMDMNPHLCD